MKYFLSILILFGFIDCTSKFNLQKRKYNRGYYISFYHKQHLKKEQFTTNSKVLPVVNLNDDDHSAIQNISPTFLSDERQMKVTNILHFKNRGSKKIHNRFVNLNFQPKKIDCLGKKQVVTYDPKSTLLDTILYVALSILTGSFFIFGLWSLVMFGLTTGSFYLLIAILSFLLAGILYFIVKRMAESVKNDNKWV